MNKKGFTLVELLAVIVILAIIALIATPIVLNVINQAQEGADARSVEAYAKALETKYYAEKVLGNNVTLTSVSITTADYNGDEVNCKRNDSSNDKVVLTGCSVGGREVEYNYSNGKATKATKAN